MRGLVVFDLDGTLADTAPDIMGTLNRLLLKEGLAALPLEKARDLVGAGAKALLERGFRAAGAPLPPAKLDRLFQEFLVDYLDHIHIHSVLFPGVLAALDALEAAGFGLAICTNKPEAHSRALLVSMGIDARFRFLAGRETFAFCKPDPRHLLETIRLSGGEVARSIMVGDSITDVDTARAARVPVIGVPFGYTQVPMLDLKPDRLIEHFDALPEAVEALMG